MRPNVSTHDALACLLEYPREATPQAAQHAVGLVSSSCPEAGVLLQPFLEYVRATSISDLEEAFTRTFDNSPDRALEVGWHTFGENYTRGTFMVRMRQRLRECGVEENGELPDHLSHLLPLIGRAEELWAGDLAHDTIAPAVRKIHDALTEQENPWANVLAAVQCVLQMHEHSPAKPLGDWVPSSWPPTPPTPTQNPSNPHAQGPCRE